MASIPPGTTRRIGSGDRYGDVLLGGADAYRTGRSLRSYFFYYDDCARYLVGACARGLQIEVQSICKGRTTANGIDQHSYRATVRDDRLLIDIGQGDLSLITGSMQVRIFPEAGPGARRPQLLAAFRHLRRVGAPRRALPPPALPQEAAARAGSRPAPVRPHRLSRAHRAQARDQRRAGAPAPAPRRARSTRCREFALDLVPAALSAGYSPSVLAMMFFWISEVPP